MLSQEDITLAYRLFLGRNPENAQVVSNLLQHVRDYGQLREHFLNSQEFIQIATQFIGEQQNIRIQHALLPSIPVQTSVTALQLTAMFDRIHLQWERLGNAQPFWSVLTQDQYKVNAFKAHRDEFYQSGKSAIDICLAALRRNQINYNQYDTCIDVGCGVGRVTNYLAKTFSKTLGVDISQPHIDLARSASQEQGISNVEYVRCASIYDYENLDQADFIFSIITLQHNPPPVILWILEILLNKLNRSGSAYIQIPSYRNAYLFEAERYLKSPTPETLEMHFLPQQFIFAMIDQCDCLCLEVKEDGMASNNHFTLSNTYLIQKK